MKTVIEYSDKDNSLIEEVLTDYLNEGWSTRDERGITIAEVEIPEEKVTALSEAGIKVNTQLPILQAKIIEVAAKEYPDMEFNVAYQDVNTIEILIGGNMDSFGQITIEGTDCYFIHGNTEPFVKLQSPNLEKWIKYYLKGFDEFEEFIHPGK